MLLEHASVDNVSVFAQRDARLGEVAHARVVLKKGLDTSPTAADLQAWCRRRLAAYKVPEQIEFVQVLPQTASGKILHRGAAETAR